MTDSTSCEGIDPKDPMATPEYIEHAEPCPRDMCIDLCKENQERCQYIFYYKIDIFPSWIVKFSKGKKCKYISNQDFWLLTNAQHDEIEMRQSSNEV